MAGKQSPTTDEDNFCVGWASFPTDPDQQECKRVGMIIIIILSHKDWEILNSRIWLAEIDIESDHTFPI